MDSYEFTCPKCRIIEERKQQQKQLQMSRKAPSANKTELSNKRNVKASVKQNSSSKTLTDG